MKNYHTETDVITTQDPLYGTDLEVLYKGIKCIVQHSQWDSLAQSWSYQLRRAKVTGIWAPWVPTVVTEAAMEADIQPKE